MTDYKEKIEIYTKYLEKKSNLVGGKYLSLQKWISQVWIVHFASLNFDFASWICDFTTWRWFCHLEMIYNLFHSLEVNLQRGSQLRRWSFNLRSGTHVLGGGFAAHFASWCSCLQTTITSSFQLQFVYRWKRWTSDLSRFETTYSMYQKDSRKYSKYVQQFLSSWILHIRFLCFSSLHSWLALAKNYEAPKLGFFM